MKRLFALVFCLVFVFSAGVFAQEAAFSYNLFDFSFMGGGARAAGMGNAFYAVSDDITGGSWNPAGLHNYESTTIGVTYSSLMPKGHTTTTVFEPYDFSHSGSLNSISSVNFAAPLRVKGHPFVLSANYSQSFDIYESFRAKVDLPIIYNYITPVGWATDTLDMEQDVHGQVDGGLYTINFSLGTRIYNNISFGLGINVYTGRVEQVSVRDTRTLNFPDFNSGVVQRATLDQSVTVEDTIKFSGVNYTLGFKYNGDKTNIGLIIRTPVELKAERDNLIYIISELNDLVIDQGTDTTYFNDLVTKYQMPWIIGIGTQYKLSENFSVAADFDMSFFKGRHILFRESITINPGGSNEETFVEIDPTWKNTFGFRLGAEYLKATKYGEVPLRFGVGFQPVPSPEFSLAGDTTLVSNVNFSLGSGIHWNQIHLDFAYTYTYSNRSSFSFAPVSDEEYIMIDQEANNRNHGLSFSFTGVF